MEEKEKREGARHDGQEGRGKGSSTRYVKGQGQGQPRREMDGSPGRHSTLSLSLYDTDLLVLRILAAPDVESALPPDDGASVAEELDG